MAADVRAERNMQEEDVRGGSIGGIIGVELMGAVEETNGRPNRLRSFHYLA
jgi:hypothetical protein